MAGTARGRRRFRRLAMERLEPRLALDASMLRITEFVASNDGGIRDVDGDRLGLDRDLQRRQRVGRSVRDVSHGR